MSSKRKALRRAIADILMDRTAAADRVFTNRVDNPWNGELPAISVNAVRDPAETDTEGPRTYLRELELDVELTVRRADGELPDDDLDDLAQDVFDLVEGSLEALVQHFELDHERTGFAGEDLDFAGDGSKPLGGTRLRWRLAYFQERPTGFEDLTAFGGADVDWNAEGTTDPVEATDAIDPDPL